MRMTVTRLLLAACIVAAAGTSPATHRAVAVSRDGAASLEVGDAAPGWKLTDPEGRTHSLSDYAGKIVVLDFWATWCGPCAKVMPRIEKLHRKYADKGVVVFGVNAWETGDPAAMMKKKKITYGLLLKGEEVADAYGVTSLPVVCIVGADGRVIYYHAGGGDKEKDLSSLIEKHLKERAP